MNGDREIGVHGNLNPDDRHPRLICDLGGGQQVTFTSSLDLSEPNGFDQAKVQPLKRTRVVLIAAFAIALAAPAHADVDSGFTDQLNGYGPRDFNAWMGTIVCKRLSTGVDGYAHQSVDFISANLPRGTTQVQTCQFLAAAVGTYCPDQMSVLGR